jgi:hypothetical protein
VNIAFKDNSRPTPYEYGNCLLDLNELRLVFPAGLDSVVIIRLGYSVLGQIAQAVAAIDAFSNLSTVFIPECGNA